jgi:hypothetical protein
MDPSGLPGAPCFAYQLNDLALGGVAAEGLLGEQFPAVQGHLEDATRTWLEGDESTRQRLLDLSRQTGGSEFIVSDDAVFDRYMHGTWTLGSGEWEVGS